MLVTDVRSDTSYMRWVRPDDLTSSVGSITLVGGNLERCLGAVYQEAIYGLAFKPELAGRRYDISLPLSAIYTTDGITAEAAFANLLQHGSPLEAVAALLSTWEPYRNSYGVGYGEFEIISSHGVGDYTVEFNGKPIGNIKPPFQEVQPEAREEDVSIENTGWVLVAKPANPIFIPKVNLKLTGNTEHNSNTIPNLDPRAQR